MSTSTPVFNYRLKRPIHNVFPGAHAAQAVGSGQLFVHHDSLLAHPDPRRIDLRASLLDPFQQYRVRLFQQRSQLNVWVIADLSASMTHGEPDKWQTLCDFVLSAAYSAQQMGDRFGFIGCGQQLESRWTLAASRNSAQSHNCAQQLRLHQPTGNAQSLLQAASVLPHQTSLVFLVSDCHFELQQLKAILQPLSQHRVVPLVLWDETEAQRFPDWGIVRLRDAEQRRSRTLWLRPDLKQKLIQRFAERKRQLQNCFRAFGMEPLFATGPYQADWLNRYFSQYPL